MRRLLLLLLLYCVFIVPAQADERILSFHSDIQVFSDGSMQVAETIRVRAEGNQIKRGIYRDFPTTYRDSYGNSYKISFEVVGVTRDGRREDWHSAGQKNGTRVYIGNKDRQLATGEYSYVLTYRTNRQLGYFDDHDELYWNVTGNDWAFPIDAVSAIVTLPPGIPREEISGEGYSGPRGAKGQDFTVEIDDQGQASFSATRPYHKGEGLTIVVSWPKGYVHKPSTQEQLTYLVRDNASWGVGLAGVVLLTLYYLIAWLLVGRDPEKGVIITRYEPPPRLTPATARYIRRMGYDHKAFAAALVNLAVKGLIEIKEEGRTFTLVRTGEQAEELAPGEQVILAKLFGGRLNTTLKLNQTEHKKIQAALKAHQEALDNNSLKIYFLKNRGWLLPGILASVLIYGLMIFFLPRGEMVGIGLFLTVWLTFWTFGVTALGRKVWLAWTTLHSGFEIVGALFITIFALPFFAGEVVGAWMLATQVSPAIPVVLLVLIGLNMLFHHLLKAPTRTGRSLLNELDGFREYLDVAEREEMNFRNPPEKTP